MTLTQVAMAIVGVIGAAVAYIIIPLLQNKCGTEQMKTLRSWAEIAIRFYEDHFRDFNMGQKKKQAVLAFLQAKGFSITENEMSMIIDALVNELNHTGWKASERL